METKSVEANQKKELTLLENIEQIVALSEKSELSDEFYEKTGRHIDAVCRIFNLSSIQAILFSHLVDRKDTNFDALVFHCKNELLVNHRKPIGFNIN
jgi:hypothetical protein